MWHEKRLGTRAHDAVRLGVPFMVTEFGACLTEAPCTQEIQQVTDVADEKLAGWAYWEFKTYKDLTTSAGTGSEGFYNKDGSLQSWKVKALARSYFMAIQGVPTLQAFNTQTAVFKAEFTVDTSIDAPTIMYLNKEFYYPKSYRVTFEVDGSKIDESQIQIDTSAGPQFYKFQVKNA